MGRRGTGGEPPQGSQKLRGKIGDRRGGDRRPRLFALEGKKKRGPKGGKTEGGTARSKKKKRNNHKGGDQFDTTAPI